MRQYSKNSWLKNNLITLNLVTLLIYLAGYLLHSFLNFNFLLNISGLFYLLFITPFNLIYIFGLEYENNLELILFLLTIFFTLYTPFYFLSNYFFNLSFNLKNILLVSVIISLIAIFLSIPNKKRKKPCSFSFNINIILKFYKKYWPLFVTVVLFGIIHLINFHYYKFIPEWDGYSKMIEIKKIINNNRILNNYRGFFSTAIIILHQFSKINLYTFFSTIFVFFQLTFLLVIFQFIQKLKINDKISQFIILFSTFGIPVLNMETDVVRPQTIFLILFPIYIYFIYQAFKQNKAGYWALSSLIAIGGLNYHEFFLIVFIIHTIFVFYFFYKKYYYQDTKNKIILFLFFVIVLLIFVLLAEHLYIIQFGINTFKRIFHQIIQINQWRWWFLSNYSGDASQYQVGWSGLTGLIKYYAYYISPLILFLFFLYIIYYKSLKKNTLSFLVFPFVFIFLIYSEILPRLNYFYLPERFWIISDILFLVLLVLFFKIITKEKIFSQKKYHAFLIILFILSNIGLIGSFYVAQQKKSLITSDEYQVTLWIKEHTPANSLFITQRGNSPLIEYFSQRQITPFPNKDFFDGKDDDLINIFYQNAINVNLKKILQNELVEINLLKKKVKENNLNNLTEINQALSDLKQLKDTVTITLQKRETILKKTKSNQVSIYALYSKQKFDNLYAQREWWLKANYYGAHIENLTKKYPLIYNKNGIYIWKLK